ncbi:MAG TPA: hypothetical protein VFZ75_02030 [Actinomycetota bacterium]|nr:hypothetical protein [Actinomycetota bacterium]
MIITATARLVVNPAQVSRESVDGYSAVGSLKRLHVARAGRAAPVSTANDVRNAPHRFELIRRVTVSMIDGSPGYDWETYAIVPGWFSFLDAEELAVWESQHVTASARIPSSSIAVTTTDRVRVINPPETALEGPWQISTIRYNGVHLRLMLRR